MEMTVIPHLRMGAVLDTSTSTTTSSTSSSRDDGNQLNGLPGPATSSVISDSDVQQMPEMRSDTIAVIQVVSAEPFVPEQWLQFVPENVFPIAPGAYIQYNPLYRIPDWVDDWLTSSWVARVIMVLVCGVYFVGREFNHEPSFLWLAILQLIAVFVMAGVLVPRIDKHLLIVLFRYYYYVVLLRVVPVLVIMCPAVRG